MQQGELIGIGRYRECYAITGSDLCLKKLRPVKFDFRSLSSHLFRDINQEEFEIIKRIPDSLVPFFPDKISKNERMLISCRPKDFDGSYSRLIEETGIISNPYFWGAIDFIASEMIKHKLWWFDVLHLGNNVLVQKISETKYKPIVIDCKRAG